MDIHAWLQKTADREPPDQCSNDRRLAPETDDVRPTRRTHRRRQRASSELLLHAAPRHSRREQPAAPARPSTSEHVQRRDVPSSPSSSRTSSSSPAQHSSPEQPRKIHEKTFEKRARHKTKLDRYDHKAKRRKHDAGARKHDSEPRTKKRKARRSGDGTATAGLVQSFQLKNGPKHNRLTLKPDVSAGIFKHGRSSGPVAPGGKGLPDLVFNEMRFLQNPKEHQNEIPAEEMSKQPTKKSRKQLREEEISSFFANRPQTATMPECANGHQAHVPSVKDDASQAPADGRGAQRPPIELPDNLFLGFGSRGPSHDISAVPKDSNSYYTWSESIPRDPYVGVQHAGRPSSARHRHPSHVSKTSAPDPYTAAHATRPGNCELVQMPERAALASITPHQAMNRRRRTTNVVSSQSLPKVGSIRKAINIAKANDEVTSGSAFHTSDILNLARPLADLEMPPAPLEQYNQQQNPHLVTSGPDSDSLRQALDAVARFERPATPELYKQRSRQTRRDSHRDRSISHGPMFAADLAREVHNAPEEMTPHWSLPQRGFSRASDANRLQQEPLLGLPSAVRTSSRQSFPHHQSPHVYDPPAFVQHRLDEEMLDDMPEPDPQPLIRTNFAYCNTRPTEDLVRELMNEQANPTPDQPVRDDQPEIPQYQAETLLADVPSNLEFEEEHFMTDDGQLWEGAIQQDVSNNDADDELIGFWRPNRLY